MTPQTIDAGTIIHYTGMTPAGVRKWLKRNGINPIGRGPHGRYLYPYDTTYPLVEKYNRNRVSSESDG